MMLLALVSIVTLAPNVAQRIVLRDHYSETCQGSSSPAIYLPACAARTVVERRLERDGWCFDQDAAWRISTRQWRPCHR